MAYGDSSDSSGDVAGQFRRCRFTKTVTLASAGTAAVALAGLLGLRPGLELLGNLRPGYIPMAPSTALCFLILSAALFIPTHTRLPPLARAAATLLVFVVILFCLLELAEIFTCYDLNGSELIWPVRQGGNFPRGQMSPATAATFVFSGLSTLLFMFQDRAALQHPGRRERLASSLGALTVLIGSIDLLAYLYGAPLLYGGSTIPMAETTALAFLLLGIALMASAGPEGILMRRISGDATSALLSRVFIPLMAGAVILQNVIARFVSSSPQVSEALIMATLVIFLGVVTAFVVDRVAVRTGRSIDAANRKLQLTLEDLKESEAHYQDILQAAMDGIILADLSGGVKEANEAFCLMSGYQPSELVGQNLSQLEGEETAGAMAGRIQETLRNGECRFETRLRRKDGMLYYVEVCIKHRPAKGGELIVSLCEISEQKLRETAHLPAGILLQLASTQSELQGCLAALTASLKKWSGCESVGIRLRVGDKLPCFVTNGVPPEFVKSKAASCTLDAGKRNPRQAIGTPLQECLCGNILNGDFDPGHALFTERGSFWCNDLSAFPGSLAELGVRRECIGEAYRTAALVPMHAGGRIVGLIQFCDPAQNRFTPALIDIFEGMADKVALALTLRQAENELHQRERLHHELLNTLPDLIWLKDPDGVYLSCNMNFERFFGARETEIIGRTDYDFVDRELADFFRDNDRRAMAEGGPNDNEEWITFADDGHRALLHTTKMPMYDHVGRVIGIMGIGRDITQLRQAEESVKENETLLRFALEGTNDGLWDVHLKDGVTFMSPRGWAILGYGEGEEKPRLEVWSELVHPEDLEVTRERLAAHLEGNADIFEVEQRLLTKTGDWKWILSRGKVVERDADGVPTRITGTHSDITEKRLLEAQLHQAQKMESVGRLAGGVAHDFNNMLGVIIGRATLALLDTGLSQPVRDHLVEIHQAAERSADLTRQLLAFARRQPIAPKVLDLNDTIAAMLKMLQRLIGEDVQLHWQPGTRLWPIKMDPSQLDQIMANLCVNARDAIDDVGKIFIETGTVAIDRTFCNTHLEVVPGNYVWISVSDDGCGMDKETLSHIYEPFFTTKGIGEGTGLGLATVYGAIKQNNGFINVYSEPGRGTTFTIFMPQHLGPQEKAGQALPVPPLPCGNETVLLVEDEPAILEMSAMILNTLGYCTLTAGTSGDALRLAQEHAGAIDLLLTDVIMPDMNGRDLAAALTVSCPKLKPLFMSGYTSDIIAHHGILADGVHFIQKPFSMHQLAEKVRETLDQKGPGLADSELRAEQPAQSAPYGR
jgi:two-component system, cell cycle sensor histidine kinase and response regulator CckA